MFYGCIFAKHSWSVCYSEWKERVGVSTGTVGERRGWRGRMEINSIFRNEKGGKNRDRVKQLRDLKSRF